MEEVVYLVLQLLCLNSGKIASLLYTQFTLFSPLRMKSIYFQIFVNVTTKYC